MQGRTALLLLAASLVVVACHKKDSTPPSPCTTCPNVSGTWTETVPPQSVGQVEQQSTSGFGSLMACSNIYASGNTDTVTITQAGAPEAPGASLQIATYWGGAPFNATLNEDLSISSNTVQGYITTALDPFTLALAGSFQRTGGNITGFNASYRYVEQASTSCQATINASWVPPSPIEEPDGG